MNNNEGSRSKVEIPAAFALFIAEREKLHCGRIEKGSRYNFLGTHFRERGNCGNCREKFLIAFSPMQFWNAAGLDLCLESSVETQPHDFIQLLLYYSNGISGL